MSSSPKLSPKKSTEPSDRGIGMRAAQYRQMVEMAWDGIVIHDRRTIIYANRCFRNMFGLEDDDDLAGGDIGDYLLPETLTALREALALAEQSGHPPISFQGQARRRNGEIFHVELCAFSAMYEGRPAFQSVVRDITDRKKMEQEFILSERLAAAGKIAFDIAHEINNPLGGIVTYTHLLLEDLEENVSREQLRDSAEKVLKLAHRCQIIVGALLDFTREDRDRRRKSSLNDIVHDSLETLEGHLILKRVDLQLELAENLPEILAEPIKIGQVVTNLIVNAAEAMEGQGRITIRTFHDTNLNAVTLQVEDNGPGIPREIGAHVFEPFFTTKPRGRGTGLGLAISHGIIKQHQGQIHFQSSPEGTTFTITFPNHI